MRVIPPLTITDAILTSSTPAEPLAPAAYAGGTTYALGDIVLVAADYTIYQSLSAGNVGNTPNLSPQFWENIGFIEPAYNAGTTYALNECSSYQHIIYQSIQATNLAHNPLISPLWWTPVGSTNRWRCFDILRNTATIAASPFTVVLTPGVRINSIALLGMLADTVRIRVNSVSGGGLVYDKTTALQNRNILDWYFYFFQPFVTTPSYIAFDLPPYADGVITIDITRGVGNIKCGSIVLGNYVYLGATQYNATSDALNFSTVTRDAFGASVLIPRRSVPKTLQECWADASAIDVIRDARTALNAVPAVWSGIDDSTQPYFESVLILGYYRQFSINLAYQSKAIVTLELEEV